MAMVRPARGCAVRGPPGFPGWDGRPAGPQGVYLVSFAGSRDATSTNSYLVMGGNYTDPMVPVAAPGSNLALYTYKVTRDTNFVKLSSSILSSLGGPKVLFTIRVLEADMSTPVSSLDVNVSNVAFYTPTALPLVVKAGQVIRMSALDQDPDPAIAFGDGVVWMWLF